MMNKRIEDYNKKLPILEVYRCIQSEGSRIGRPTFFYNPHIHRIYRVVF